MPKFVLVGVDGKLGSLAADFATEIVTPDQQPVFTNFYLETIPAEKPKYWHKKRVVVVTASYSDTATLERVLVGAEAVTFISTWLFGETRRRQYNTVVDTAKACGVRRVCYTSFIGAGLEKDLPFLPQDYKYTEGVIYDSGLEYNVQRNYLYTDNIPQLLRHHGNTVATNGNRIPGVCLLHMSHEKMPAGSQLHFCLGKESQIPCTM
jgi:hypothetical protein